MSDCTAWAIYTRTERRHRLDGTCRAWVEIPAVADEPGERFALLDLSPRGLCFDPGASRRDLTGRARLPGVVIRVGECEWRGTLLVAHLTRDGERTFRCGGSFTPESDLDAAKIGGVVDGLRAER